MKKTIKKIISTTAYYLKLWRLLYFLYPIFRKKPVLAVVTFHRVLPKEKAKDFFVNYDIGQDSKSYEMSLEELSHYYDFIDLDDFIKFVSGKEKPKKHSMLITFDDTDYDFVEYALPILAKNKWPAVVFAPTGYIDTEERFWHLKISNMMSIMDNDTWQKIVNNKLQFPESIRNIIDKYPVYDNAMCHALSRVILNCLGKIKEDDITPIIDKFEELIEKPYTLGIKCMDWEQLQELEKQGIAVESHTVTHRRLEFLDDDDTLTELRDSKTKIESMLNKKVKAFCYPAGSYNERTPKLVGEAGYEVAFSTRWGLCNYPYTGDEIFTIPRISFAGSDRINMNLEIGRLIFKK